ncbi:IS3 family transposase [Paenibacillus thiaminolyticus]
MLDGASITIQWNLFGNSKMREVLLHTYHTFEELEGDIQAYIHFYNYERLQAKLNGLVPMEFRTKAA